MSDGTGGRVNPVVLLGPQRQKPRVAETVDELGVTGRLAVVTAGWEERESEDAELDEHLSGRSINLALLPRTDDVFGRDPDLAALWAERERRRRELRDLYHLRLAPQLHAVRTLLDRLDPADLGPLAGGDAGRADAGADGAAAGSGDDGAADGATGLVGPEIADAIAGLRALDAHHRARVDALDQEVSERIGHRPVLDRHRHEVAELLSQSGALLVAGGDVGTLLAALRLFAVAPAARHLDLPVIGWSAGAMVLAERVVLFHDQPARGAGDAEVFGSGLGLVPGVIPMPHAVHRLNLDDPRRVAMMARRFAPDHCVALDYGDRLMADRDRVPTIGDDTRVLTPAGGVTGHGDRRPEPPVRIEPSPWGTSAVTDNPDAERALFEQAARSGPDALRRLIDERRLPVVGDGWVLYVWVGQADEVRLQQWIAGVPAAQRFERTAGTDLWTYVGDIQRRARVEYKFEIIRSGHHELVRDPFNHDEARDPFGSNSVVRGPDYVKPEWSESQPTTRRGRVVEAVVNSTVFGEPRPYSVYLPARFRPDRTYPLLVVHDGLDYVNYASLVTVLDNLIHRLELPPLVAALTQSPNRLVEYGASTDHARFIVEDLLGDLQNQFRIGPPSRRVLAGASFGAVASLYTAWSHPGVFNKLLLQSGSFAFTDVGIHDLDPVYDPVVAFVNRFRADPGHPASRIFLSAGIYERLIYYNRSLLPVLQSTGAEVRMVESQDGHNWEHWRDLLRDGLTYLLPGPQWLVYE